MKNYILFFSALILLTMTLNNCSKEENLDDDPLFPPLTMAWRLSFFLADDNDNNLLPWSLPPNPVANPDDYFAYHEKSSDIGYFSRNDKYGHIFRFKDGLTSLRETSSFKHDSSFVFYACFGNTCDTIIVYPHFPQSGSGCSAKKIYWNGNYLGFYWNDEDNFSVIVGRDSSETYHCNLIPIPSSISHLF
ncbi:MAG: hypothetical protein JJU02_15995 [Cryomorphaceae bacterium]|nr:hypothetical protein [Cryomorphaceae bacterium]